MARGACDTISVGVNRGRHRPVVRCCIGAEDGIEVVSTSLLFTDDGVIDGVFCYPQLRACRTLLELSWAVSGVEAIVVTAAWLIPLTYAWRKLLSGYQELDLTATVNK